MCMYVCVYIYIYTRECMCVSLKRAAYWDFRDMYRLRTGLPEFLAGTMWSHNLNSLEGAI